MSLSVCARIFIKDTRGSWLGQEADPLICIVGKARIKEKTQPCPSKRGINAPGLGRGYGAYCDIILMTKSPPGARSLNWQDGICLSYLTLSDFPLFTVPPVSQQVTRARCPFSQSIVTVGSHLYHWRAPLTSPHPVPLPIESPLLEENTLPRSLAVPGVTQSLPQIFYMEFITNYLSIFSSSTKSTSFCHAVQSMAISLFILWRKKEATDREKGANFHNALQYCPMLCVFFK